LSVRTSAGTSALLEAHGGSAAEGPPDSARVSEQQALAKPAFRNRPTDSTEYFCIASPSKDNSAVADSPDRQESQGHCIQRPGVVQREPAPEPSCEVTDGAGSEVVQDSVCSSGQGGGSAAQRKQALRPIPAEVPMVFARLHGEADNMRERRLQAAAQLRAVEDQQLTFRPQLRARQPSSPRSGARAVDTSGGSSGTARAPSAGSVYARLNDDAERRRRLDKVRVQNAPVFAVPRNSGAAAAVNRSGTPNRGGRSGTSSVNSFGRGSRPQIEQRPSSRPKQRPTSQPRMLTGGLPNGVRALLASPRSVLGNSHGPVGMPCAADLHPGPGGPEPDEVDLELLVLSLSGRLGSDLSRSLVSGIVRRTCEGRGQAYVPPSPVTPVTPVGVSGSGATTSPNRSRMVSTAPLDTRLEAHVEAASVFGGFRLQQSPPGSAARAGGSSSSASAGRATAASHT